MNSLEFLPQYQVFFNDLDGDWPQMKPIQEITNMEEWKELSPKDRIKFLYNIRGWLMTDIKGPYPKSEWENESDYIDNIVLKFEVNFIEQIKNTLKSFHEQSDTFAFLEKLRDDVIIEEFNLGKSINNIDSKILDFVDDKLKRITDNFIQRETKTGEKITWLGSAAVFVFIFQELVNKGYIEPSKFGAEHSMSGFAKLCLCHFDFSSRSPSQEYLERAMRNPEALSQAKKSKFTIPPLSDVK